MISGIMLSLNMLNRFSKIISNIVGSDFNDELYYVCEKKILSIKYNIQIINRAYSKSFRLSGRLMKVTSGSLIELNVI